MVPVKKYRSLQMRNISTFALTILLAPALQGVYADVGRIATDMLLHSLYKLFTESVSVI